jgi:hypothetical protein
MTMDAGPVAGATPVPDHRTCQAHGDRPSDHAGEMGSWLVRNNRFSELRVRPTVRTPALVRLCALHAKALAPPR